MGETLGEKAEKFAVQYSNYGLRDDEAVAVLLRAVAAENAALRTERDEARDCCKECGPSWQQAAIQMMKERDAALARVRVLEGLLTRWIKAADTGVWRDSAHLSISAHPVADETRAALAPTAEGKP